MINVLRSPDVITIEPRSVMPSRRASFLLSCILLTLAAWPARSADILAPKVDNQIPAAGANVYELLTIEVFFDKAVSGVDFADLLVNGIAATNMTQISDR